MVPLKETEPTAIGRSDSKKRNNDMWGMHWLGPGMGWGWAVFGWAMMVLFWGGVIWLFASLVRGRTPERHCSRIETPGDIAARRFAAGEITEEEYERIVNRLQRSGATHNKWPADSERPSVGFRKVE